MKTRQLRNAVWVDPGEGVFRGTIHVKFDYIDRIDIEARLDPPPRARDLGEWILPGFVDLHSDAIEKSVEPRPRVRFPAAFAIQSLDRRLVANGITSCCHAVAFAGRELGLRSPERAQELVSCLNDQAHQSRCRSFIHIRYEISDRESVGKIESLIGKQPPQLLSFMDHSPGQGQFRREKDFVRYLMLTYSKTERKCLAMLAEKRERLEGAEERIERLAQVARGQRLKLVCHDLEDPDDLPFWTAHGISISEFPISLTAARASLKSGCSTLFGAPNLVRGQSSGRGVKASRAIAESIASGICSGYLPESLLPGFQTIIDSPDNGLDLDTATALFTRNPAEAAGLRSLGRIGEGYPADLIRVAWEGERLCLKETIVGGKTVFLDKR